MDARDYLHKNNIKPDQNIEVRIYGKNGTLIRPLHKLLDEYLSKQLILHSVGCSANDIKEKISDSLNYYNVDETDLDEMLENVDSECLSNIMQAITTLNTLLFKCEA